MDVKVFIFAASAWTEVASPSPFCLKMLMWLRIAKVEHEIVIVDGPPKSKSGKAPYALIDGQHVEDSAKIIEILRAQGYDPDSSLDASQRSIAHAFSRMFQDHLYFAILRQRWVNDTHFSETARDYFADVPPVLRSIVPRVIRRKVKRDVEGQGLGRRPWADVVSEAKQDIDAFAELLGDKPFVFDEPSTIDAIAYGFIANITRIPQRWELTEHVESTRLPDYIENLHETYYP